MEGVNKGQLIAVFAIGARQHQPALTSLHLLPKICFVAS